MNYLMIGWLHSDLHLREFVLLVYHGQLNRMKQGFFRSKWYSISMAGCRVRSGSTAPSRYVRSKDNTTATIPHLPILIFQDGSHLSEPTNAQIAEKIGLKTRV